MTKYPITEHTLLPDGVTLAGIIREKGSKSQHDSLTSQAFRVMYESVSTKEVNNANREQKPETWDSPSRSIPQADLHLRGGRGRGWQALLSTNGWSAIQEPIGGRDDHHGTCLRRMGLLERSDYPDCSCTRCRADRGTNGASNREYPNCRRTNPGEKTDYLPCTQPERNWKPNSLVLPRMRQEFLGRYGGVTQDLPAGTPSNLSQQVNRITIRRQAPAKWGLSLIPVTGVTNPLVSRVTCPPKTIPGIISQKGE